jgi:hypothetical protein
MLSVSRILGSRQWLHSMNPMKPLCLLQYIRCISLFVNLCVYANSWALFHLQMRMEDSPFTFLFWYMLKLGSTVAMWMMTLSIYILSDFFVGGLIRDMALIIWWFRQGTIILLLHLLRYEMLWNSSMVSFFPELCSESFVSNRLITVVKVLLSWFASLVWLTSDGLLQYRESALLPWSSYVVGFEFP